jgi:hypothetical protein
VARSGASLLGIGSNISSTTGSQSVPSERGNYVGYLPMPKQWLTYSALAERLNGSPTTARQQAIRACWPRRPGKLGYAKVLVDVEEASPDVPSHGAPEDAGSTARPTSQPTLADPSSAAGRLAALAADFETLKAITASADLAFARQREPAERVRSANEGAGFQAERARAEILERRLAEAQLRAEQRAELERQLAALRAKLTENEDSAWQWRSLIRLGLARGVARRPTDLDVTIGLRRWAGSPAAQSGPSRLARLGRTHCPSAADSPRQQCTNIGVERQSVSYAVAGTAACQRHASFHFASFHFWSKLLLDRFIRQPHRQ